MVNDNLCSAIVGLLWHSEALAGSIRRMTMAYIRTCAALIVLLGTASCAFDRAERYNMSGTSSKTSIYTADKPAPMDKSVRVATQDCTGPVTLDRGNLYCKSR